MKKLIAIYGGTELSAAESWFIVSLTHALLTKLDVIVVTGGFHYNDKVPGEISTDFSVLQGAKRYAAEKGILLQDCFATWLPDPEVENDPQKKKVTRFKEGEIRELTGESAQARRFSMVRDVDAVITVKGKRHTLMVLDFALTMNKPALPLAFTNGDSREFWNKHKDSIRNWFDITADFTAELEVKEIKFLAPPQKEEIIEKIITAINKGLEKELTNETYYTALRRKLKWEISPGHTGNFKNTIEPKHEEKENVSKKQLSMFLSYAHEDKALKDDLDKQLTALKRSRKISVWQDSDIKGGTEWDKEIRKGLINADIILLLISPDFIASTYIMDVELEYALKQHEQGKAKVIPVFLRSTFTEGMPFEKLQGYPDKDNPVNDLEVHKRDHAFFKVVEGISNDIDSWLIK